MARNKWTPGKQVKIMMGVDAGRIAKIIPMSKITKDGSGTPRIGKGHYKPISKDSVAIEFVDKPGEYDVCEKGIVILI